MMTKFNGFNFNDFEVVKHKKLPKLKATRGANLIDWSFSGGIIPIWENGKEGHMSLKSTDDEDQMKEFDELVKEFNEEATQEEWDEFYKEVKESLVTYYKRQIEKNTAELNELLADN